MAVLDNLSALGSVALQWRDLSVYPVHRADGLEALGSHSLSSRKQWKNPVQLGGWSVERVKRTSAEGKKDAELH